MDWFEEGKQNQNSARTFNTENECELKSIHLHIFKLRRMPALHRIRKKKKKTSPVVEI